MVPPPPKRSTAPVVAGIVLLCIGGLFGLGQLVRLSQGTLQLIDPSADTFGQQLGFITGTLISLFITTIGPIWLGIWLVNSNKRNLRKWQQRHGSPMHHPPGHPQGPPAGYQQGPPHGYPQGPNPPSHG